MNEIEKLYKNAGVEMQHLLDINTNQFVDVCPLFTAEKQIRLLQFCFDKYEVIGKTPDVDRCILYITSDAEDRAFVVTDYISCETWEESIAGLINRFWQDFTEKEKQQIKEILGK